jgi:hypothetical protein
MARRIEVSKPRSASEDEAQRLLARILPASWAVTTNIKEHMFSGPRRPEIDSLLVTPLGIFVLDFKNFRGAIAPMLNRYWGGLEEGSKNPLEQIYDNLYAVKDLVKRYDNELENVWIEPLIVLTHEDAELDWGASDLNETVKMRVSLLGEVESKVRQIAANTRRTSLDASLALKVLEALRPISIPDGLFSGTDWVAASSKNAATDAASANRSQDVKESRGQPAATLTAETFSFVSVPLSKLDAALAKMFPWPKDQESFREHLRLFDGGRLLSRNVRESLSLTELEFLARAKQDFENRRGLAYEIERTIDSHDVEVFAYLSPRLAIVRGVVSPQRTIQIVKGFFGVLCHEAEVATVNRLVVAYRALGHARQTAEFRQMMRDWERFCRSTITAKLVYSLYGVPFSKGLRPALCPAIPILFSPGERERVAAQELIRKNHLSPGWEFVDRFILPEVVPWSSRRRAERALRQINTFSNSKSISEIRTQLGVIADILEGALAQEPELKTALVQESLTGEQFDLVLHRKRARC